MTVTISDIHLRDALYSDTDDNGLALWVQNQMIARYGDVKPLADYTGVFTSPAYSFRIAYPESLLFSLARLRIMARPADLYFLGFAAVLFPDA